MTHPAKRRDASQPALFDTESTTARQAESGSGIARVLVEETVLESDYLVPESLAQRVHLGSRVHVPLQGRRAIGVVLQLLEESGFSGRLTPVAEVIATRPMFPGALLKLAHWISTYYLCPLRQVLRTM